MFLKRIDDDELISERLVAIHDDDFEQLKEKFEEFINEKSEKRSQRRKVLNEVMICFWFAIHLEKV